MSSALSKEALDVLKKIDFIDLHLDTYIWDRIFNYDLNRVHTSPFQSNPFFSQVDLPRLKEGKLTGGVFVITTNPARLRKNRTATLVRNIERLSKRLSETNTVRIVKTYSEYIHAKKTNLFPAFLGIQGGNCFSGGADDSYFDRPDDEIQKILRVTLIHLTNSFLGETSTPIPFKRRHGLTSYGKDLVRRLNEKKIFVDLAHSSEKSFFDAVEVHDRSKPILVTHTGVSGVYPHWRNLTDHQLKVIADSGGVIGIMFQKTFLSGHRETQTIDAVITHLEHVIDVVGEDFPAIGSDFDGMIIPPKGLENCLRFPALIEKMLEKGWSADRIQKICGGNFLRALKELRG